MTYAVPPLRSSVLRSVAFGAGLTLVYGALAVGMLWPLLLPNRSVFPDMDDAYFSAWRLAWVAHQLPRDPGRLFDANIFSPATGTLAFSDAMLLPALLGAPLLWAGLPLSVVHNLLLGAAFVSSMWFAFLLVRHLTGSTAAAWLASIVFGFAPFRLAHIAHLELQWVMWMPLAMWLLHRFVARPTAGRALAVGAAVTGQTFSSIYYGVYLSWYLAAAALVLWLAACDWRRRAAALMPIVLVPLLAVALVYGPPYARTRAEQGPRSAGEVAAFSATPSDFVRVPPYNRLRGTPGDTRPAGEERSLYPGAAALVLAAIAAISRRRRLAWTYAALLALSADAALGTNGLSLPALQQLMPLATSFRAPARFGALMLLSIAVLAGIGAAALFHLRPRWTSAVVTGATLLCLAEYWSAPIPVRPGLDRPTEAHQWLAHQPPGTVVLELPLPEPERLWLYETTYQLRSVHHWQPLVNGYSAFAPREYLRTLDRLRDFPDEASVERLRDLGVRFVVLNPRLYSGEGFEAVYEALIASPAFWPPRSFGSGDDELIIAELKRR